MTARNFFHFLSQSLARDAPLKTDWEKSIVACRENGNGNGGPLVEPAGLAEDDSGFLARPLRACTKHRLRHIMQEVGR
jgi:hypothetical protein